MSLEIKRLTLGVVSTNAYIIGDTESKDAILIDPVDNAPLLYKTIQEAGWTLKLILATHGHFDHVLASKELKELSNAPFWVHEYSPYLLKMLPQMGRMFGLGQFPSAAEPDHLISSTSETIEIGAIKLKTLFTPGHAPDHLCYYLEEHQILFCGDTIFRDSIGRTDLQGGDTPLLMESIFETILPLGDDVRLLAGHMQETTIGRERRLNPYLQNHEG